MFACQSFHDGSLDDSDDEDTSARMPGGQPAVSERRGGTGCGHRRATVQGADVNASSRKSPSLEDCT